MRTGRVQTTVAYGIWGGSMNSATNMNVMWQGEHASTASIGWCVQVGVFLATAMWTDCGTQWVAEHGDDKEFEDWYYSVEPVYPAETPMEFDISIGDQLEYARLTADAVAADQVENARFLGPECGGHDLGTLLMNFLEYFTAEFDSQQHVLLFAERCRGSLDEVKDSYTIQGLEAYGVGHISGIMVADPQVVHAQNSQQVCTGTCLPDRICAGLPCCL